MIKKTISNISNNLIKSIVFSTIAIVIICIIIAINSYHDLTSSLTKNLIKSLEDKAIENARVVSQNYKSLLLSAQLIASCHEVKTMDWERQKKYLLTLTDIVDASRFQVIDSKGFLRSTSGGTLDVSHREYFKKALSGNTVITDPFQSNLENKMVVVCATPIKNDKEEIVGVLTSTLDYTVLSKFSNNIKIKDTGYAFIINKEGVTIAHPNAELVFNQDNDFINVKRSPILQQLVDIEKKMINGKTGYGYYKYYDKDNNLIDKVATFAPISGTNWSLAVTVPQNELFSEVYSLRNKSIFLISILMILFILFSYLVAKHISEHKKINLLEKDIFESSKLLDQAVEMDKIRTEFFMNITHELRTPLNVIISTLQLFDLYINNNSLLDKNNTNKNLKIMKLNCFRLLRLVNNLIDSSRIDAGFFEIHMQNCNIINLIEKTCISVIDYTNIKKLSFTFTTDINEKTIACDPYMIERIILNLLSNAIKFTDPGGKIHVRTYTKQNNIFISVKDTGIGISIENQKQIFERFRQVDKSLTRKNEGSGIGLSIVKSIVNMHGGSISVISDNITGSEFIVKLPIRTVTIEETTFNNNYVKNELVDLEFSDIYF